MTKIAYRQMTGPDGAIANREPFDGNSLWAEWRLSMPSTGRLNIDDVNDLESLFIEPGPVYVIYSYSTPIAWAKADHPGWVTTQRFSVTTSKGQGYVRAWLNHHFV
jgi:hypothetical protein